MADTLIDEPPPPTLRDPHQPPPPPGAPAPPPRGPSGRGVAIAFAALLALVAVGLVALYLFVYRYEAVARRHVPSNANLVVRVQVADLVLFAPVRENLWSVAVQRATRSGKSRGERIREATGVNLATDLRELIAVSTDGTSWALIVGGRLARGRFVDGLAKVAQEEGWPLHREGDLLVGDRVAGRGAVIGQAEDGTIVVGTDAAIVNAALPASDDARRLALPEEGAVTFVATRQAWSGAKVLGWFAGLAGAGPIERASGRIVLGSAPELTMTIVPQPGVPAADLARDLENARQVSTAVTGVLGLLQGPKARKDEETSILEGMKITAAGDKVTILAPLPYDELDRGCRALASLVGLH